MPGGSNLKNSLSGPLLGYVVLAAVLGFVALAFATSGGDAEPAASQSASAPASAESVPATRPASVQPATAPAREREARPWRAAPKRKLTGTEYRQLVELATAADGLKGRPPAAALKRFRKMCLWLDAPTALMDAVSADCASSAAILRTALRAKAEAEWCNGNGACFRSLFDDLRQGASALLTTSLAANAELARRGLRGRCADLMRTSESELGALRKLRDASRGLSSAIAKRSRAAFVRALRLLEDAEHGLAGDSLEGSPRAAARSCPHA